MTNELSLEEMVEMVPDKTGVTKHIILMLWAKIEELEEELIDLTANVNRQGRTIRSKFTD